MQIQLYEGNIFHCATTNGTTCYFAEVNADKPIRYGTSGMDNGNCPSTPGANGGNDFADKQEIGWE